VIAVSGVTMLCKAAGVLPYSGTRGQHGTRLQRMIVVLLPGTLSALMAKELFTHGGSLSVDARAVGVAVAVVATALGASPAVAIGAAVVTTAIVRHFA
jgi:hypothetical protein